MGSKRFFFFATPEDLREPIQGVEASRSLKYYLDDMFTSPEIPRWKSLLEITSLGISEKGHRLLCSSYIAIPTDVTLLVEPVRQVSGETRYTVNQLLNPASIIIRPCGVFGDEFVLCGEISTGSDDPVSVESLRVFKRAFIKAFTRFDLYLVGPGALARYNAGARLVTMGVEEDPKYDLKPNECPPKDQKPRRHSLGKSRFSL